MLFHIVHNSNNNQKFIFTSVDGMWSDWGAWSPCSETCGNGTRSRTRSCNNPTPANDGAPCKGDSSDRGSCFKDHCPSESDSAASK